MSCFLELGPSHPAIPQRGIRRGGIFTVLLMLLLVGTVAQASDAATPVSAVQPTAAGACQTILEIGTGTGEAGGSGSVPVLLTNDAPVAGVQFDVVDAPDDLRVSGCTASDSDFSCTTADANGIVTVLLVSFSGAEIPVGTAQTILELQYDVDSAAAEGAVALSLQNAQVADTSNQPCSVELRGGSFTVTRSEECAATLAIGSGSGETGETGSLVPVSLTNATAVRGVQFNVADIPDVLRVSGCTAADADFTCSATESNGVVRVVLFSLSGAQIPSGTSQKILDLLYDVDLNAPAGAVTLTPTDVLIADAQNQPCTVSATSGNFDVRLGQGQCQATLDIDDGEGEAGSTGNIVPVNLVNNVPVRGVQFDVVDTPDSLFLSGCTSRIAEFDCATSESNGVLSVLMVSLTGARIPVAATGQTILELAYDVDSGASPGSISLQPANLLIADDFNQLCETTANGGSFSVSPPEECDASVDVGDGEGLPGTVENRVPILLTSSTVVRGVQLRVVDTPDVLTVRGCEAINPAFNCSTSDVEGGGNVILVSLSGGTIPAGTDQTILNLLMDVDAAAPAGSVALEAVNVEVVGAGNIPCETSAVGGNFDVTRPPTAIVVGEVPAVNSRPQIVSFPDVFTDPIVIAGPPTFNGGAPGVIRFLDIGETSFRARFQAWEYLQSNHGTPESFPYIISDSGRQVMEDGSIWEFGRFSLMGLGEFESKFFEQPFDGTPALFVTQQEAIGSDTIIARVDNVSASGFDAAMFEEEGSDNGHGVEEFGYLAIYNPNGDATQSGIRIGSGVVDINGMATPFLIQGPALTGEFAPVASWNLKLEEEQSADEERTHAPEALHALVVDGKLFAQAVSFNEADPVALRRMDPTAAAFIEWGRIGGITDRWLEVPLAREYDNPVVIAKPVSTNGADAGVIRLREISGGSFQLRYQEWEYLNGRHSTGEEIFYMVAEAGTHDLFGLTLEVRTLETDNTRRFGGFEQIAFGESFPEAPCVFAAVQTFNGNNPVITRTRLVGTDGFQLAMQEEEGGDRRHGLERVGWIAITQGDSSAAADRRFRTFTSMVGSDLETVAFGTSFSQELPTVVANISSVRGADPGVLRFGAVSNSSIEMFIQEEQSLDDEVEHRDEEISIFVAE